MASSSRPPAESAADRASKTPRESDFPDGGTPHFTLFGIPVRIGAGFWLVAILFGFQQGKTLAENLRQALALTAIVFVSVLIHELGHAVVGRSYGLRPAIMLHAFGGVTSHYGEISRGRRIIMSLAGPFAGFAFGGLVWLIARNVVVPAQHKWIVERLLFVNLGWGILNLVPVLPLDGGNVLAAALGPKRVVATWSISAVFAIAMAALSLKIGSAFLVVLFGFGAIHAIGQARKARGNDVDRREGLEDQLRKAKVAMDRGDIDDAYLLADDVVHRAKTLPVKNGGYTALAWVHVLRGDGLRARKALAKVQPPYALDAYTVAAVEDAAGDHGRARAILEEARKHGLRTAPSTKLLIDLLARDGRLEEAVDVAHEDASLLDREDVRGVYRAALAANAPRAAARLAARLFELHARPDDALDEARALSTAGDLAGALAALAHAIQLGPVDRDAVRTDPAFSALSGDERFEKILA